MRPPILTLRAALIGALLTPLWLTISVPGAAAERPRALFLSKSAGFEHSSIAWPEGGPPSHVDRVLQQIATAQGLELDLTKDASTINREALRQYELVIFYTTGDLTQAGRGRHLLDGDAQPPMSATGVAELIEWIREGGGFVGYHSATDTFRDPDGPPTPYIEMIGAEFRSHGRQFEGRVKVVDPDHLTMRRVPVEWRMLDEWYLFRHLNRDAIHVLAVLDPGEERQRQPQLYDLPDYPVIWCRELESGRIYYNAMGHREDVWDDPVFQRSVADALLWARGQGEADASPAPDSDRPPHTPVAIRRRSR